MSLNQTENRERPSVQSGATTELVDLDLPQYVNYKLARACSNPLRTKILDNLSKKAMSISQFSRLYPKYSYSQVRGQFQKLKEWDFLEVVDMKTGGERRSAKEIFYRANIRSLFDQAEWAELPPYMRSGVTASAFSTLFDRIAEALKAGTIDVRPDRHFSWSDPDFDQKAWDETIDEFKKLFYRIQVRGKQAKRRLKKSGGKPIPMTIALACFESPPLEVPESGD